MSLKEQIIKEIYSAAIVRLAPSQINGAGVGVFSLVKIKEGETVFNTDTNNFIEWFEVQGAKRDIIKYIKKVCNYNKDGFWIDCLINKINPAYYVNHSDYPNLYHDLKNDIYTAIKDIKAGEELTCKYLLGEIDWV